MIILNVAGILGWLVSSGFSVYHVSSHLALGVAKGTIDIMLATGDESSFAYSEFMSDGIEDPSWLFRPALTKGIYNGRRPRGWFLSFISDQMPLKEQLGLHLPYWRAKSFHAWINGPDIRGPSTFRNLQVPFWSLSLGLLILAILICWLDRPLPNHLCLSCRYDLTGNTTGICPECGAAIADRIRGPTPLGSVD